MTDRFMLVAQIHWLQQQKQGGGQCFHNHSEYIHQVGWNPTSLNLRWVHQCHGEIVGKIIKPETSVWVVDFVGLYLTCNLDVN